MRSTEQGWRHDFAPLAVPTAIIADDPELLATAGAAYADWMAEPPFADPVVEIRLEVESAPSDGVSCRIMAEGSRLTLCGNELRGWADASTGKAQCTVPRQLIGDPRALAAEVTDTLLLFLLARSGRTPLHAAGVLIGDTLLVLTGPSGSGKSTLALAGAQCGHGILSDDTLYVEHQPAPRIWGWPRPIHVFPKDAPDGPHETRRRGGKLKAAVPLPTAPIIAPFTGRAVLILLERGEQLALTPIDADAATARLSRLEPGFNLLASQSEEVVRTLASNGAWRLTLAREPRAAMAFLRERFGADRGPR